MSIAFHGISIFFLILGLMTSETSYAISLAGDWGFLLAVSSIIAVLGMAFMEREYRSKYLKTKRLVCYLTRFASAIFGTIGYLANSNVGSGKHIFGLIMIIISIGLIIVKMILKSRYEKECGEHFIIIA